jgi:serine/threonine-protein kinase HipA
LSCCTACLQLANRDDHVKNFAFILDDATGDWALAPAYDLTHTPGPGGEHTMTVAGEGAAPGRPHILRLAEQAGIARSQAEGIIDEVRAALARWGELAAGAGVENTHARQIAAGFPPLAR